MIKFIVKRAPKFQLIFGISVGLGVLFLFNWLMSDIMGEAIVKYEGECVVGEYSTETHTGSLTCGEYEKEDGSGEISDFVSKVYIQKRTVFCKITENEYTGSIDWICHSNVPGDESNNS